MNWRGDGHTIWRTIRGKGWVVTMMGMHDTVVVRWDGDRVVDRSREGGRRGWVRLLRRVRLICIGG